MGEQLAEHVGQPLPPEGQEGDVVGGAVLERGGECARVTAARLTHERDALVEGRDALEDGRGVVERAPVHHDQVPVGEGLCLQ